MGLRAWLAVCSAAFVIGLLVIVVHVFRGHQTPRLALAALVPTAAGAAWTLARLEESRRRDTATAAETTAREQARRSQARIARMLSASLDLPQTLALTVETAMDLAAAPRALLMLLTPERDALYAKVGRGVEGGALVAVGQGRSGWVAKTGRPLRLPQPRDDDACGSSPAPAPGEPAAVSQLLVPLCGRGEVIGVLSLLRDDPSAAFTDDELDAVCEFAKAASVAIENVMLHREAQRLSVTDHLTGLWNLRYFQIQADRELQSALRSSRPLSLAIIDLDHFKRVNDGLGHQIGDRVLTEAARRIRDSVRVPDVVARYGGEEFVVLLPGTDHSGALATAERIRAAVEAEPIPVGPEPKHSLLVTCSAGVSSFPVQGRTLTALLRAADAAMYVAKAQGRNQVVGADSVEMGEFPWPGGPAGPSEPL